jgi:proteasome lid subunit RPN8/RPN11
MPEPLRFQLQGASWTLEFAPETIEVMRLHAQTKTTSCESVGQLYARDLAKSTVIVEHATILKPTEASRARVRFNPKAAYAERVRLFERGLHCVGLWHTHPEPYPSPSAAEAATSGIVFAIVGNLPMPYTLRVWVDNGSELLSASVVQTVGH